MLEYRRSFKKLRDLCDAGVEGCEGVKGGGFFATILVHKNAYI